jgi:hypothetical protein
MRANRCATHEDPTDGQTVLGTMDAHPPVVDGVRTGLTLLRDNDHRSRSAVSG